MCNLTPNDKLDIPLIENCKNILLSLSGLSLVCTISFLGSAWKDLNQYTRDQLLDWYFYIFWWSYNLLFIYRLYKIANES